MTMNRDELIDAVIAAGITTPALIERFAAEIALRVTQKSQVAPDTPARIPSGQKYTSADLNRHGIANVPTNYGPLYYVIDSGKGNSLTQDDLRSSGLLLYDVMNILAMIRENDPRALDLE